MKFLHWMDSQKKWIKILFCIPFVDIIWVIYRLVLSAKNKDWLSVVICVLLIFVGIPWLWLLDLLFICVQEKVLWFKYEPKTILDTEEKDASQLDSNEKTTLE